MQRQVSVKSKYPKFLIYIFAYFILSFTFHNFFKYNADAKVYVIVGGLLLFVWDFFYLNKKIIAAFVIFSALIGIQGVFFGYSLKTHITSFYFNIFLAYVLLRSMPKDYYRYLANAIYYLSIISSILYFFSIIYPEVGEITQFIAKAYNLDPIPPEQGFPEQILIYTYENSTTYGIPRNAGFCHEPGAFAVALIYAIVIFYLQDGNLFSKKNLFLMFCVLSTFSSAGFLSLYILFIAFVFASRTTNFVKFSISIVGVLFIYLSFTQLDFMKSKIEEQYTQSINQKLDERTDGRIFASMKAIYVLGKYPISGRGFIQSSKVDDEYSKEAVGYGFPAFASQVGIPLFILVSLLFYRSIKSIAIENEFKEKYILILVLSFLPVLFSQAFLPSLLFNMLILQNLFRRENNKKNMLRMAPSNSTGLIENN